MDKPTRFHCGEALDVVNVTRLHEQLQKELHQSNTLELDAANVAKADTAGLQLLIALSEQIKNTGGKLVWYAASEKLIECAQKLGLAKFLEIPSDTPAK